MKLTVKKYKHFNVGREGGAMKCELYVDGTLAALVENQGNGGPNNYRWVGRYRDHHDYAHPPDIAAHVAAAPAVEFCGQPLKPSLDMLVEDAIEDALFAASMARKCKKSTVFRLPTDGQGVYREYKTPFTPASAAMVRAKHPDAVIFNEQGQ